MQRLQSHHIGVTVDTCIYGIIKCKSDMSDCIDIHAIAVMQKPAGFNLLYPPNYKTNTNVSFTCRVEGAYGNVKYQWSSTAERRLPTDSNSQALEKNMLNSSDIGKYACIVTDANSNTGSATTEMEVIGESLKKL